MPVRIELVVFVGPDVGKKVLVTRTPFVVGRDLRTDLPLSDPRLALQHFQITAQGDEPAVENLASSEDLFVNGQQVQIAKITDRDRIRAGQTELIVYVRQVSPADSGLPSVAAAAVTLAAGAVLFRLSASPDSSQPKFGEGPLYPPPDRAGCTATAFTEAPSFAFVNPDGLLYAIADAASDLTLAFKAAQAGYGPLSLFVGEAAPTMADLAPYVFPVPLGAPYLDEWVGALGKHAGILLDTTAGPEQLFQHLRRIFVVTDEDGQDYFLRYYDPRVLPNHLETCSQEELAELFGPVHSFIVESADADGYLAYQRDEQGLLRTVPLGMMQRGG